MNPIKKIALLLIFLLSLVQSGNSQLNIDIVAIIDSLEGYMTKHKYPGVLLSIVTKDSTLFASGLGYANVDSKEKVSEKHLFRVGSISKSFTALALLKILHDKQIPLSTPIKEIDPNIPFTNKWADTRPITIEHILEHTTGFDGWHAHAMYNFEDSSPPSTADLLEVHQNSFTCRWEPGTIHSYNNPGYVIAGHLIETLAQEPYFNYIKREILEPLEMYSSGFYFNKPNHQKYANGYEYKNGKFQDVGYPHTQGGPAGELCSNAEDMAKYLHFMLNRQGNKIDSSLFTQEMFDRIEKGETNLASKYNLLGSYGLANFQVFQKGYEFHGHDGGIDGFSSRYIYSPEADLGIMISTNSNKSITRLLEYLLDQLYGQEEVFSPRKELPLSKEIVQKYEGFYMFQDERLELRKPIMHFAGSFRVTYENEKLYIKSMYGRVKDSLIYAHDNLFYRNNQLKPSAAFFELENGKQHFAVKRKIAVKKSFPLYAIMNTSILLSMLIVALFLIVYSVKILIQLIRRKFTFNKDMFILYGACISFPLMFIAFGLAMSNRLTCGQITPYSIVLLLSSLSLIILTALAIYQNFNLKGKISHKITYTTVTISITIISTFFWYYDFIGLQLWSY